MSEKKTVEELTNKEILEDVEYYLDYAQISAPKYMDRIFDIIRSYTKELEKREMGEKETNQNFIDFLEKLHFNLNGVITERKVSMMIIKKIEELKGK